MQPSAGVYELEAGTTKVFVIKGSKNILVDTGLAPMPDEMLSFMEKTGLKFQDEAQRREMREGAYPKIMQFLKKEDIGVNVIVCTHYHLDHTGNVKRLKEALNVPVAMLSDDIPFVEGTQQAPVPAYIPEELRPYLKIEHCMVEIPLHDGDILGDGVKVIHTPGHTKGSICLLVDNRIVIAGDALIGKNEVNPAAGPNELNPPSKQVCADYDEAVRSLRKLLQHNFSAIYPTHGKSIAAGGKEKLEKMLKEI